MGKFQFYHINEHYISYLHSIDTRVQYNNCLLYTSKVVPVDLSRIVLALRVGLFFLYLGFPGPVFFAPVTAGWVPVRAVRRAYRLYHAGAAGFPSAAQYP